MRQTITQLLAWLVWTCTAASSYAVQNDVRDTIERRTVSSSQDIDQVGSSIGSTDGMSSNLNGSNLYESGRVVSIAVDIPEESWKELSKQTRDIGKAFTGDSSDPFTWFQGSVTIDGLKIENVGIRKKGFIGSLDENRPSLKIDFTRFVDQQPLGGIEVLTLNNNKQDESLISQTLAYRIFAKAGVATPRCNLAKVTVNGRFLGLYSNVESIDKAFLKHHFGSSKGDLYEGTVTDFTPRTIDKIEIKNNKKKRERPRLESMAELLSKEEVDIQAIGEIVDLDNFLRYWATESLLAFWDGYANNQNNYWFYDDPKTGKWRFIPWGADMTMEASRGMPQFGPPGPASLYAHSYLTNRLIHQPEMAERYRATMKQILDEVWNEKELMAQIDELEAIVSPVSHEHLKNRKDATDRLRSFVQYRRGKIERELKEWPVRFPDKPRKPTYQLEFGKLQGEFATTWSSRPQHGPTEGSSVSGELVRAETAGFEGTGAAIYEKPKVNFPFAPPGPTTPQIDLLITWKSTGEEKGSRIILTMDKQQFDSAVGTPLEVSGMFFEEGSRQGFMPFGRKFAKGTLTLFKVSAEEGGKVAGKFDLQLFEIKGGLFDQGQQPPR